MPFDGNRNRITLSLNVNLTFLRARIKMMGGFGKWPFCWVHPSSSSTRPSGLVGSSTSMLHLNAALKLGVHNLSILFLLPLSWPDCWLVLTSYMKINVRFLTDNDPTYYFDKSGSIYWWIERSVFALSYHSKSEYHDNGKGTLLRLKFL